MKGRVRSANAPDEGLRVIPPSSRPLRQSARRQISGAGSCGVEARGVDRVGSDDDSAEIAVEPPTNLVRSLEAPCPLVEGCVEMWRFG